jgi:predicted nuclease with TOPRIM domain
MEIRAFNNAPVIINADLILLINKMRSAWRQKIFRSKQNGKKTYSFVMSTNIEKRLKELAGKGEVRKALETLIINRHNDEIPKIKELNDINNDLKSKLSDTVKENRTIREANKGLNQTSKYKNSEIAALKNEIKQLQQDNANLINELQQLKEKHNNQFRKEVADSNQVNN